MKCNLCSFLAIPSCTLVRLVLHGHCLFIIILFLDLSRKYSDAELFLASDERVTSVLCCFNDDNTDLLLGRTASVSVERETVRPHGSLRFWILVNIWQIDT